MKTNNLSTQSISAPKLAGQSAEQVTIKLTMPVEQAEQVLWQGSGPHEPMGKLVHEGALNAKDLGWGIEYAYNQQVKEASRTLLAHLLGDPATIQTTLRYGPQVYGGSPYLEEKQYDSLIKVALYAMGGIMFGLYILYWLIVAAVQVLLKGAPWLMVFTAIGSLLLLVLVVLSPLIWWGRRRIFQELDNFRNYRNGREAEERVLEELRAALDNRWTIFRNLVLPGAKGDIDLVLVGPSGVYVLEVKAYKPTVRINNGAWERQEKKKWRSFGSNPSVQAKRNAAGVSDYLKCHGIPLWVNPIVVLTEPQPVTNFVNPTPPVWLHFDLPVRASALNRSAPNFDEATTRRILDATSQLVENNPVQMRHNTPDSQLTRTPPS